MGWALVLGLYCASFLATLVSAKAFTGCIDGNTCRRVRVIGQGQDVSDAFRQYDSAQEIDLSGNMLEDSTFFGKDLRYLSQLQTLNLSYNLLIYDPFVNSRNNQLKTIDLTYNDLTQVTLPVAVTRFYAVRNKLSHIHFQGTRLNELFLSKNHFDSLNVFSALNQLTTLDLSCNRITELNTGVFSKMDRLIDLKLAHNHIHKTSGLGFPNSLQFLDVSNNILTMFDGVFTQLPNIRKLYLQNNKIMMTLTISTKYGSLQQIDVSGNDWNCNKLKDLYKAIPYNAQSVTDSKACSAKNHKSICCSDVSYADRLIEYYRQHYSTLEDTGAQNQGEVSCTDYTPGPCDGDDTLVAKVAENAVSSAAGFAKSKLEQLEIELAQQKSNLEREKGNYAAQLQKMNELTATLDELTNLIEEEYSAVGLTEQRDDLFKLQALFQKYGAMNIFLKAQIKLEERNNQDKLSEVTDLETQLEELRYRRDKLSEDFGKRNRTVSEYQLRINELNKKLGKTA